MVVEVFQTLEDKDNIDEVELDGPFFCHKNVKYINLSLHFVT